MLCVEAGRVSFHTQLLPRDSPVAGVINRREKEIAVQQERRQG